MSYIRGALYREVLLYIDLALAECDTLLHNPGTQLYYSEADVVVTKMAPA